MKPHHISQSENLIQKAFHNLYPSKPFIYQTIISYNRRLAPFNANIRLTEHKIHITLHEEWKEIDNQIVQGLIENLLGKIFKKKLKTINITLYKHFLKTLPQITQKTHIDPYLELSFDRNNKIFFENQIEKPNLKWGQNSIRKLAHYNLQTDTIMMSSIFKEAPEQFLDFIMYHEMLHKYHKFTTQGTRDSYHSPEFKQNEQKFPEAQKLEKEISLFAQKIKQQQQLNKKRTLPIIEQHSKNTFLSQFF